MTAAILPREATLFWSRMALVVGLRPGQGKPLVNPGSGTLGGLLAGQGPLPFYLQLWLP